MRQTDARIVAALVLVVSPVAFASCASRNPIQLTLTPDAIARCQEKQDCSAPIAEGISPSREESCLLEVIRPRCDAVDHCLVGCITTGKGQDVGGGCLHLCGWVVVNDKGKQYKCPEQVSPEWCKCFGLPDDCGQTAQGHDQSSGG